MTQETMKARLSALTGETNDDILLTFLDIAKDKVLSRCYPYRNDVADVPERYQTTQLEIAVYLLNKRGAEGETAHNENGINRSYENASVPESMLKGIVPFGSVFLWNNTEEAES
jgi:hypothetical protein